MLQWAFNAVREQLKAQSKATMLQWQCLHRLLCPHCCNFEMDQKYLWTSHCNIDFGKVSLLPVSQPQAGCDCCCVNINIQSVCFWFNCLEHNILQHEMFYKGRRLFSHDNKVLHRSSHVVFALKVRYIDAFNFEMHRIFFQGSTPLYTPLPSLTSPYTHQTHKNVWVTLSGRHAPSFQWTWEQLFILSQSHIHHPFFCKYSTAYKICIQTWLKTVNQYCLLMFKKLCKQLQAKCSASFFICTYIFVDHS